MSDLTLMMNIGKELERKLKAVGIDTAEKLIETGSKEDKEKFRRNTRVFQGILTQSSAKFAEKMRVNFYDNKFLY